MPFVPELLILTGEFGGTVPIFVSAKMGLSALAMANLANGGMFRLPRIEQQCMMKQSGFSEETVADGLTQA